MAEMHQERLDEAFGKNTRVREACANQKRRCLVEFNGVSLHFANKAIFDDLNLTIRSGECLVLLGPSGVGKSTLLRLLLETLHPWCGSIYFDGTEITHLSRERLNKIRTRIGMVFQSSALISSLSVSENLALALREPVCQAIPGRRLRRWFSKWFHFNCLAPTHDLDLTVNP